MPTLQPVQTLRQPPPNLLYNMQLVYKIVSWEQSIAIYHFAEDTAYGPDVYRIRVFISL